MLTLILVRHGATEANEAGLYIGRSESALSLQGKEASIRLCHQLAKQEIDHIYMSPSNRVRETIASILTSCQSVQVIEALQEIDFGICEMKDYNWLKKHYPKEITRMIEEGTRYRYPQGESLEEVHQRVAKWLNELLRNHLSGNVLIAAHGGTIRCILSELLVKNASLHWHFKIDTGTMTIVRVEEGFPIIEKLNEKC